METKRISVALASPPFPRSRDECVATVDRYLAIAQQRGAQIVCFPETYLPGYRGEDFPYTPEPDQAAQEEALAEVRQVVQRRSVALILPAEWESPYGLLNLAFVINADGTIQGYQTKNQIPPEEETYYVAGEYRRLFDVNGSKFGIAICHEGSRYPETVRWAASRGAQIVFHPHLTGSDVRGNLPRFWGDPEAEYYEKAALTRAVENEIYYASVNYAFRYQESATCLIAPDGRLVDQIPYGEEGFLVADLDLAAATGRYAHRVEYERYLAAPDRDPLPGTATNASDAATINVTKTGT